MAKVWSTVPLGTMFELSTIKHLRGHKFRLVEHRSNLEVRRNFFTERLINRWNSSDQRSLDVDSVNCFKNQVEEYSDGFLRGLMVRLTHWLHKFILVWPQRVNNQVA